MSERIDIYEHSFLDAVLAILLIIFFPIGIIVLISRVISKNKKAKIERLNIETSTYNMIPDILRDYHNLYQEGLISQKEFRKIQKRLAKKKG